MIETKILGDAVGIQRQDVIDNSETTVLPSLANGVIAGHFKRGRMDKPFKVTSANYRSLLGHDPSNPSYLAVEDAFKNGVSELSILRTGSTSGGAGAGGDGGSDSNTPKINFLKLISEIIRVTPDINAGIVYKINDEPIRASIFQNPEHAHYSEAVTPSAMFQSAEIPVSYFSYQPDLLEHGTPVAPAPLDPNASYFFGLNDTLLSTFFAAGQALPEGFKGIEGEVVVTLYPASYLPSANIDQDLFDYIINPTNYTAADLQYFAEKGGTPAIKNSDGSYTIKSQLTLPSMG